MFVFNEHGVCTNANILAVCDGTEIRTAEYDGYWYGGYSVMSGLWGCGFGVNIDKHKFSTEQHAIDYYLEQMKENVEYNEKRQHHNQNVRILDSLKLIMKQEKQLVLF